MKSRIKKDLIKFYVKYKILGMDTTIEFYLTFLIRIGQRSLIKKNILNVFRIKKLFLLHHISQID
jgi:hypothetical protein